MSPVLVVRRRFHQVFTLDLKSYGHYTDLKEPFFTSTASKAFIALMAASGSKGKSGNPPANGENGGSRGGGFTRRGGNQQGGSDELRNKSGGNNSSPAIDQGTLSFGDRLNFANMILPIARSASSLSDGEGHVLARIHLEHVCFHPCGDENTQAFTEFSDMFRQWEARLVESNLQEAFTAAGYRFDLPTYTNYLNQCLDYYITYLLFSQFASYSRSEESSVPSWLIKYSTDVCGTVRAISPRLSKMRSNIRRMYLPPELVTAANSLFGFRGVDTVADMPHVEGLGLSIVMCSDFYLRPWKYNLPQRVLQQHPVAPYDRLHTPPYFKDGKGNVPNVVDICRDVDNGLIDRESSTIFNLVMVNSPDELISSCDSEMPVPASDRINDYIYDDFDTRVVLNCPPTYDYDYVRLGRYIDYSSEWFSCTEFSDIAAVLAQVSPGWSMSSTNLVPVSMPPQASWHAVMLHNFPVLNQGQFIPTEDELPIVPGKLALQASYTVQPSYPILLMVPKSIGLPDAKPFVFSYRMDFVDPNAAARYSAFGRQTRENPLVNAVIVDGGSNSLSGIVAIPFPGFITRVADSHQASKGTISQPRFILASDGSFIRIVPMLAQITLGRRFSIADNMDIYNIGYEYTVPYSLPSQNLVEDLVTIVELIHGNEAFMSSPRFGTYTF